MPVASGRLKNAIHVEAEGKGRFNVIAGDNVAWYGHIVEHGGVSVGARPFMTPAAESARIEVTPIAREALMNL